MGLAETSLWLVGAWVLGLGFVFAILPAAMWLRMRRVRLQVEARYLSAVAQSDLPMDRSTDFIVNMRGEHVRRLLNGLIGRGFAPGLASWKSSGSVRYDADARERAFSAETYCIPGVWWAQIRRVRLRGFGWVDEIHEVEGDRISSHYWWLGLYRVDRPGFGPEPLALSTQALGEVILTPWAWFLDGVIDWYRTPGEGLWEGRLIATGFKLRMQLDGAGRPRWLELEGVDARVRVDYDGWRWIDRVLIPSRLQLTEGVGSVNEFIRLTASVESPQRAPIRHAGPS
jgi:hypothetical protein